MQNDLILSEVSDQPDFDNIENEIMTYEGMEVKQIKMCAPGIYMGKLNIMSGDPGLAKTFLVLAYASKISQGQEIYVSPMIDPIKFDDPGNVLYINNEDGKEDTIVYSGKPVPAKPADQKIDAVKLLKEVLADGPIRYSDIEKRAVTVGLDMAILKSVKKEAGVASRQLPDKSAWEWYLQENNNDDVM